MPTMHKVVLLRHGESVWNMENRFTGWTDVDLTQRGVEEAKRAGEMLKEAGFAFDCAYTSVLKRAIKTLWLALETMDLMWIPVRHSWRLNERDYGVLAGVGAVVYSERAGAVLISMTSACERQRIRRRWCVVTYAVVNAV